MKPLRLSIDSKSKIKRYLPPSNANSIINKLTSGIPFSTLKGRYYLGVDTSNSLYLVFESSCVYDSFAIKVA
jgi:hypothetical protein